MNGKKAVLFCGTAHLPSAAIVAMVLTLLLLSVPVRAGAQTAHFSYAQVALGGGFNDPGAVAVDGSGDVFVADSGNNAVKEIPPGCVTSSCVKTLGAGFDLPNAVAVDGSGDVFVADSGNSAVQEIPPGCVTSGCVKTVASGFSDLAGVAVDGGGDVFVTDQYKMAVFEVLAAGGYTTVKTLASEASGIYYPAGIAVDGSGNVFVADTGASISGSVIEILAAGGYTTVNTLASIGAWGIAVDGSGNVFVTDPAYGSVSEIPAAGGYTTVNTLGSGFDFPFGVAADGSGNVFVADTDNNRVVELETASVNFETVAIGQTSATLSLTFTFDSGGTIGSPVALTQGAPKLDFAVASTGTCTTNGTTHTYAIGDTCTVDVTFTPKFAGQRNGSVLLQDGSGNTIAKGYVHGFGSGPQVAFRPGTQSTVGSGFSSPSGVAVDGSGNVFVADAGNNALKEILATGGYVTVKTLASGIDAWVAVDGSGNLFAGSYNLYELPVGGSTWVPINPDAGGAYCGVGYGLFNCPEYPFAPVDVAVDGSGNLFVTIIGPAEDGEAGINGVVEIPAAGGYTTSNSLGGPAIVIHLAGVAVDGSGNVFVADSGNNVVDEIPAAGGYTKVMAVGSGFGSPSGVAVDGSGNVFVADTGNNAVKEILAAGGYTTVGTVGSGFSSPSGVAVDGSGNVFVADTGNNRVVKLDFSDAPSLSFGSINVGANSAEQTLTLQNIGNAPLALPVPTSGGNPSISQTFTLDSSASTACPVVTTSSSAGSLASGASCTLSIGFDPTVAGTINGSVVLTDNTLNAAAPNYATQTITLQGSGIQVAPAPAYTLAASSPTVSIAAGSSGTVTLNLTSTNYAGTVTLAASSTNSAVAASAPSVTLTNGGTGTSTVTITTTTSAVNHAPAAPWKSGGTVMFCAVLLGAPFTIRRKRLMAVLLTILAISLAGLLMACGGGSSSSKPKAARTYTVTLTPTGTGTVTNAAPVNITVTVQ